jgi:hypothetical protein
MPFGSKAVLNAGIPVDQPRLLRDGVIYRETDCHSNSKFFSLEKEHPERAAKGDLGNRNIVGMPTRSSFEFGTDQGVFRFTTPARR